MNELDSTEHLKKPSWLKIKLPTAEEYSYLKKKLTQKKLHTICESGSCPNIGECWAEQTATFMILGDICTRGCKFCGVSKGKPEIPNSEEAKNIAETIRNLKLKHCVLTSVTRDDIEDGGAYFWAETINVIKAYNKGITIEALIPDFDENYNYIDKIIYTKPDIISHNVETVKRLTPLIRIQAEYRKSLNILEYIAKAGCLTKSGFMVGLGETDNEVYETISDIKKTGCQIITIGQYLQPSKNQIAVKRYVNPEQFNNYKTYAQSLGFRHVESNPLVRSSYHSVKHIL